MCELIYCVYANVHIYIILTKLFAVFLYFFSTLSTFSRKQNTSIPHLKVKDIELRTTTHS